MLPTSWSEKITTTYCKTLNEISCKGKVVCMKRGASNKKKKLHKPSETPAVSIAYVTVSAVYMRGGKMTKAEILGQ